MSELEVLQLPLNNLWVVLCAFIIFFMQAGFAMLESGLVRSKNAVNVIMKNYIDMSVGAVAYFTVGFGLMFGVNRSGFIGTSLFAPADAPPELYSFLFFQMMFAATAATIVSGALAERIRYWPYIAAAVFISAFIYPIFGSWVWGSLGDGNGWLSSLGFIDFAGSAVVHAVGGWCAFAGVIVLGPRAGRFARHARSANQQATHYVIPGHNLPLAALGAFVLWFGFFAFNAGSALSAGTNLGLIALNTHMAGACGVIGAVLYLTLTKRPLLLGYVINGGLGGLVAICAGANDMSPFFAAVTGFIAGIIVIAGMDLLERLHLDDAVGAVSVHALGGTWGVIAIGMFQRNNLFDPVQLGTQVVGALSALIWALPVALAAFYLISLVTNLRVSMADERRGLDYSEHFELGYPEFQAASVHQGRGEALLSQDSDLSSLVSITDTES